MYFIFLRILFLNALSVVYQLLSSVLNFPPIIFLFIAGFSGYWYGGGATLQSISATRSSSS